MNHRPMTVSRRIVWLLFGAAILVALWFWLAHGGSRALPERAILVNLP